MRGFNKIGHIVKNNRDMHVCGYTLDSKVLVQEVGGKPQRAYSMYLSKKGVYFNFKGKRMYLDV